MPKQLHDLSHVVRPGMFTHPGLPGPEWEAFRSRADYQAATGTTFQIDRVCMVGNTGTYLDSPFHRFADGLDLGGLALTAVADLATVVVDRRSSRRTTADDLERALGAESLEGKAVLLHTGGDAAWGSEAYAEDAPYLTGDAAEWLVARGPALFGIDAVNIDDLADLSRPAHTVLLGSGVLIVEHLTGLAALPARGARLHVAPLRWEGVGTWPVRAYAVVDRDDEPGP